MGYLDPMSKDPNDAIKEMLSMVERPEAERLLIAEKISPSMAYKLVRGTYRSKPGAFYLAAIERARLAAGKLASAG